MIGKILRFILCLVLCFTLLPAYESADRTTRENKSMDVQESNITKDSGADVKNKKVYPVDFLEDFINCYNYYYYKDNGNNYIQPCTEWYSYVQDFGRYKGYTHYEFTADKKIWTLPTITVYTPRNKKVIKELTVNFDDHSYTDKMYKQYEEMCFYTLKVFFPDMDKKKLTKLYKKLNKRAYNNIFPNEQGFHSDNPPSCLYFKNGTGVYPYFAYGESVRMCIIPVTKKVIKSYKKKGTRLIELDCNEGNYET